MGAEVFETPNGPPSGANILVHGRLRDDTWDGAFACGGENANRMLPARGGVARAEGESYQRRAMCPPLVGDLRFPRRS